MARPASLSILGLGAPALVAAAGCKKKRPAARPPDAALPADAGSDARVTGELRPVDAGAATAAADAAAIPAYLCSGRWEAPLTFNSKTCPDASLAPYGRVAFDVARAADGYDVALVAPPGWPRARAEATWTTGEPASCSITATTGGERASLRLKAWSRGPGGKPSVSVALTLGSGADACTANGIGEATFVPDGAPLPEPPAARAGAAGTYELRYAWQAPEDCPEPPPAGARYVIAVEPGAGNALVPSPGREARLVSRGGKALLELFHDENLTADPADPGAVAYAERTHELAVDGGRVTGTVSYKAENADDDPLCKISGSVGGTFIPAAAP